ncbi:hypothetical protein BB778_27490 [Pluralibacter gergoviae]|nr:hypothetical protein BB778_27490 [Pluralibacter gergoviae]
MTFRIAANVFPSVNNLPTLNDSFSDLLVNGSLSLIDKPNLQLANGLTPGASIGNLAEAFAKSQTGSATANAYISNILSANYPTATTDFSQYFKTELTARGGLHVVPTLGNNPDKAIGLAIRTLSNSVMTSVLSTAKDIYIDLWCRVTRLPVVNAGGASGWKTTKLHLIGMNGDTPTSASNLASLQYDLTSASLPAAPYPSDSTQLLSEKYLVSGMGLNENRMLCSAVSHPAVSLASPSIPFTIFEGNYNGTGIIIYSSYMEDLTTSGRTADEVAAIRQRDFNAAFSLGGRFYSDSWLLL